MSSISLFKKPEKTIALEPSNCHIAIIHNYASNVYSCLQLAIRAVFLSLFCHIKLGKILAKQ